MNRKMTTVRILILSIILCSFSILPARAFVLNSWANVAPMPTPPSTLTWVGSAAVNGKVYAMGCYNEYNYTSGQTGAYGINDEYNPSTNTWTAKTAIPTPRNNAAMVAFDNNIFVIGGFSQTKDHVYSNTIYFKLRSNLRSQVKSVESGSNCSCRRD